MVRVGCDCTVVGEGGSSEVSAIIDVVAVGVIKVAEYTMLSVSALCSTSASGLELHSVNIYLQLWLESAEASKP